MLDEFTHAFDEVLIDAGDGRKSFWGHRDDTLLLDDRKDGFDAKDIDAEVLLWEDAHPLEGPLKVASKELAISGDHVEWTRIHNGLDVGMIESRKVIPKDDGPFFLFAGIVDSMDDWVMLLEFDVHHDEMVEPVV